MSVRRRLAAGLVLAGAVLAGCGSGGTAGSTAVVTTTPVTSTTVARHDVLPTTTVRTSATSTTPPVPIETAATVATPSTAATTSTAVVPATDDPTLGLPTPAPAPVDPNGREAVQTLGSIEIPKLGVTKTMYEGVTLTTLNRGPGHWPGTAMPGELGNVVVGGHRVSHDKPFRNIDQLVAGDEVVFTTAAGRFVYTVVSSEVVTPDAVWIIDQTADHTATLFACTPPGSTSHRLVVHLALQG